MLRKSGIFDLIQAIFAQSLSLENNKVIIVTAEFTAHTVFFHYDAVRLGKQLKRIVYLEVIFIPNWLRNYDTTQLINST